MICVPLCCTASPPTTVTEIPIILGSYQTEPLLQEKSKYSLNLFVIGSSHTLVCRAVFCDAPL